MKILKVLNMNEYELQPKLSTLNILNINDSNSIQINKIDKINNDNIFIYHDTNIINKKQKLNNNDNDINNTIKNALEDIVLFNSLNDDDKNNVSDSNVIKEMNNILIQATESPINNQCNELISSCKVYHTQMIKYKSTGSGKLKTMITNIVSIIDEICKIENTIKKLEALYELGLWQSEEEILLNVAEYYQNNEHIATTAISVFIAMLLVKSRTLKAPATRTFLRTIELTIKRKPELTISGLISRTIQVPNHTNSFSNICPISIMNRVIGIDKRLNTNPGNFQFELFQRSARQLLSKQQKDILLYHTFSNSNSSTDFELIKLIDGIISPLALLITNESLNIAAIFDEWKKIVALNQIIMSNNPNNPIMWDNDNLKVLNTVLTGCADLSIGTIRCMLTNLDDISVGNVVLCSSTNLAAVTHTITTRYISIIKSHDDLNKLVKGLLMRLSNIMANSALSALEKYV